MIRRTDEERTLREAIARLRRADHSGAPHFDSLLIQRPVPARHAWRWAAAATVAAALLVVALLVVPYGTGPTVDDRTLARARELAAWQPPSDELWNYGPLDVASDVPTLELTTLSGLDEEFDTSDAESPPAPGALPRDPGLV